MKTWIGISFLVCITAVLAYTDIKHRKVYNKHLLLMLMGIIVIGLITGGISDKPLRGMILPFILHLIPFRLRLISAGDVKVFMLLGLALGLIEIIDIMALSYLIGGTLSLIIMLKERVLLTRLRYLYCYMTTLAVAGMQYPYRIETSKSLKLPFVLAIHMALVLKAIQFCRVGL